MNIRERLQVLEAAMGKGLSDRAKAGVSKAIKALEKVDKDLETARDSLKPTLQELQADRDAKGHMLNDMLEQTASLLTEVINALDDLES